MTQRRREKTPLGLAASEPLTSRAMVGALRSLPAVTWLRAVPYAAVAAVLIGVPADLIDTPIFGRPVETRPIDYVIWAITSALIGLVFAIRVPEHRAGDDDARPIWGGFVSFLAVGCPVCNQVVVALVGTSGALSWWAPVQPVVGLVALGIIGFALKRRLDTYQLDACPLPGADAALAGSRAGGTSTVVSADRWPDGGASR